MRTRALCRVLATVAAFARLAACEPSIEESRDAAAAALDAGPRADAEVRDASIVPPRDAQPTDDASVSVDPRLRAAVEERCADPTSASDLPTLIVVGDSWAAGFATALEALYGGTRRFCDLARGGTTALQWGRDDDLFDSGFGARTLAAAAAAGEPSVEVLVFLGGNDLRVRWSSEGDAVYVRIESDLASIVDAITEAEPTARVLLASYDLPHFSSARTAGGVPCPEVAEADFGATLVDGEVEDVRAVNEILYALRDVHARLAADRPTVEVIPLWGLLQGRDAGDPDLESWGEARNFGDCIHPNRRGGEIILGHLTSLDVPTQE